jgi:hypothetical protein
MIFIPSQEVIKQMVLATLQFGYQKGTFDKFLLRFGLVEDEDYHLSWHKIEQKEKEE